MNKINIKSNQIELIGFDSTVELFNSNKKWWKQIILVDALLSLTNMLHTLIRKLHQLNN